VSIFFRFSLATMAHQISDELWTLIADMLQTSLISHICKSLWLLLRRRHVILHWIDQQNCQQAVSFLQESSVHSLKGCSAGHLSASSINVLLGLPSLRALRILHLQLEECGIDNNGAQSLASARSLPHLHTVVLKLHSNALTHRGAQALASLKDTSMLQEITLSLSYNQVGNEGCAALATFASAPQLRRLELSLGSTSTDDHGVQAFSSLKDLSRLTHLSLKLFGNGLTAASTRAIALGVRQASSLHSVFLNLSNNSLDDVAAESLSELVGCPSLRVLTLNLNRNLIGDRGARALARLAEGPKLLRLTLWVALNPAMGPEGMAVLRNLEVPQATQQRLQCSVIV